MYCADITAQPSGLSRRFTDTVYKLVGSMSYNVCVLRLICMYKTKPLVMVLTEYWGISYLF